jgi:FkbM family methyltransferase
MKIFINEFLKKINLRVEKISHNLKFSDLLVGLLNKNNINLVLDVGANAGQFAQSIRTNGYDKNIVSFEPLLEVYNNLLKISKNDNRWKVYKRCALGDRNEKSSINVSAYEQSSSILSMTSLHSKIKKNSEYVSKQEINIYKLDSIFNEICSSKDKIFLKVDTQGYEDKIIDGAKKSLSQIKGILLEASLVELYKGTTLWLDLILKIQKLGFLPWLIDRGFSDNINFRTLQVDIVFLRK